MGTLVSMLFFVTLVVVAILIFLLSQKNDTIANLVVNINELENDMYKFSKLDKEKKQIQEDLEYKIKTKSLTIENQMEQITKLEKALNKAKESLQSTVEQNEENKKNINSLEEKNNDLEEHNCELKNQISQIKKELKKAQTQMQNKNDNPFERMAIW